MGIKMKQKYLYHRTKAQNIKSIIEKGLLRKLPERRSRAFICMSVDPNSWYNQDEEDPEIDSWGTLGNAVFRIDIESYRRDNSEVEVTSWLPESDEVCVWGDIPAKYLKLM